MKPETAAALAFERKTSLSHFFHTPDDGGAREIDWQWVSRRAHQISQNAIRREVYEDKLKDYFAGIGK
jgi:hypothetical protein